MAISPTLRKRLIISITATVAGLSLLATAGFLVSTYFQKHIAPNTYVSDSKLSLLGYETVDTKLETLKNEVLAQTVTLAYNDASIELTVSDLGLSIPTGELMTKIQPATGLYDWANPVYWYNFFKPKNYQFTYAFDQGAAEAKIRSGINLPDTSKNAELVVESGKLVIKDDQTGFDLDMNDLQKNVEQAIGANQPTTIALTVVSKKADIDTALAMQTKQAIEGALAPIELSTDNYKQSISVVEQLGWISIAQEAGKITWSVDRAKVASFVKSSVAKKFNVQMLYRTKQSDTGAITGEGREGREVTQTDLTNSLYQSAVQHQGTSTIPVTIPYRTIAIEEKTVNPDFTVGLFAGKYIEVNVTTQKLYTIENNVKVGEYTVSTGKWSTPTPQGTFSINNKNPNAFSSTYKLYMPYWMAFVGSQYGIHALPYWPDGRVEGQASLGRAVSHGCIRLSTSDAAVVYAWAEVGIPVYVHS